ncbi:MAG: hypothetical protein JW754_05040 [Candidatus Aenigmarchaeota archaeon]|nr:hypothetical protein [Candidatus Aenigmarchaeota archaeon]
MTGDSIGHNNGIEMKYRQGPGFTSSAGDEIDILYFQTKDPLGVDFTYKINGERGGSGRIDGKWNFCMINEEIKNQLK